jgi:transaldolase/glucose-6-phosphate isomerase
MKRAKISRKGHEKIGSRKTAPWQSLFLGDYAARVERRAEDWRREEFGARLWRRDATLWSASPLAEIEDRLGWLGLPRTMRDEIEDIEVFARAARKEGFRDVVLLGMGGSSLAAEVFQRTFGRLSGCPRLVVLDSTHPQAVRAVERGVSLRRALFLVSSKSGTTLETLSLFRYFWAALRRAGIDAGGRFVAITDRGTPLDEMAIARRFRAVFHAPADVGGRYSALTVFGLLPAALIGVDVRRVLFNAGRMAAASSRVSPPRNPALTLGAALGEMAVAGRDKVTFLASPALAALPVWIEQLIAESTGKDDRGIVPVVDEPPGRPGTYGADRVFVSLEMAGRSGDSTQEKSDALRRAGHPLIRIRLDGKTDLGAEFFRWEVAVAAVGAVLGVHPFNQPDVERAKELARQAMRREDRDHDRDGGAERARVIERAAGSAVELRRWLGNARPGDYISLHAYLAPTAAVDRRLAKIRAALRDRFGVATTVGYGPRFLHSTGQLHKGGPNTGLFLQLLDDPVADVAVPETDYTFGELIRAQAEGDHRALVERERRVLRFRLGRDIDAGLKWLFSAVSNES